jgi:hypothetical protein
MTKKLIISFVVLCMVLGMVVPVSAQTGLTITSSDSETGFPLTITFKIAAKSSVPITEIRLQYEIEQLGYADVTAETLVSFTPSTSVTTQWAWDLRYIGGLPPGSTVRYWWICKDSSGTVKQTTPQEIEFDDTRFSWKTISEDLITLYWYEGNDSFTDEIMTAAQNAIARLGNETGASLKEPVRLYIYASQNDLLGSMIFPQEWTGGVTFTRYGCIAIGISTLNLSWGKRAITHEITHLVTSQMTLNPYNEIPAWLDEGLAMYNEGPMQPTFSSALTNAINTKSLLSVQTLASPFSALTDVSYLSYAESYSIVDYLIRTYGKDKMLHLLETFHQGSTYDGALQEVFGIDTQSLNAAWQKTLNIPTATAYLFN